MIGMVIPCNVVLLINFVYIHIYNVLVCEQQIENLHYIALDNQTFFFILTTITISSYKKIFS